MLSIDHVVLFGCIESAGGGWAEREVVGFGDGSEGGDEEFEGSCDHQLYEFDKFYIRLKL